MVASIPKHLLEKISLLYSKYKTEPFTFTNAVDTLQQNERYTGQILSALVKAGWLDKKRERDDKRKKIYRINNISQIIEQIGHNMNLKRK